MGLSSQRRLAAPVEVTDVAAAMAGLGRRVLDERAIPVIMQHAVSTVADVLAVDRVQVLERLSDTGMLAGWASIGADTHLARVGLAHHATHAIAAGDVLDLSDLLGGAGSIGPADIEARGGIAVVIPGAGGAVFGALCAQTIAPRRFAPTELDFLRAVAAMIGLAVERAAAEERASFAHEHDQATRLLTRNAAVAWLRGAGEHEHVFALAVAISPHAHPAESDATTRDEVVRVAARRMRKVTASEDLVARTGRLELAVVGRLETPRPNGSLDGLVESIHEALQQPIRIEADQPPVRVRVVTGIASGFDIDDPTGVLTAAEVALQSAIDSRVRTMWFDETLRATAVARSELEHHLQRAVTAGQLTLLYQPVIDVGSGAMHAVEALVRWEHPTRGTLPPGEFIEAAERTGAIVGLGNWVVDQACAQLAGWTAAGSTIGEVAVNLSPLQLIDGSIVDTTRAALARHGIDPGALVLEVTETALVESSDVVADTLRDLKALGVRIALDDFGTGYSSLGQLKRLPRIDELKVDRSFVAGLGIDPHDEIIVASIVGLAREWGAVVVAEGIETDDQRARVHALGVQRGQGYLWGRPTTPDQLEAFAARPI